MLSAHTHTQLTEKEQFEQLIEEHQDLINKIANHWRGIRGYDFEDLRSLCLLGLYRATKAKRNEKTSFKTVAYRYMNNECRDVYRQQNRAKAGATEQGLVLVLSLDGIKETQPARYERYEQGNVEWIDFDDLRTRNAKLDCVLSYIFKIKRKQEREIMTSHLLNGVKKSELARSYGLTYRQTNYIIQKHSKKAQERLAKLDTTYLTA